MLGQQQSTVFILTCILLEISGHSKIIPSVAGVIADAPVVSPPQGKIRGTIRNIAPGVEVYAFTGIPFAQPPIGELRYKKPQPVEPWGDNTYDATNTPPSCMQGDTFYARNLLWVPYGQQKNEDCLYLNVWTPTLGATARLPVMAWLHGGGYHVGSAAMALHDGAISAAFGGVVVATIAYRLQSYGFLYDGTEDAPGNQGLHDTRLALQWIQDNIAEFGGDVAEVTLFGFSIGGVATGYHLLSPGSKHLFRRAIMQSGPATKKGPVKERSLMLGHTKKFAQMFGCSQDGSDSSKPIVPVSCLRNVNASLISAAEQTFVDKGNGKFEPIFGDEFLPVDPSTAMFPGDKDVVIGYLVNEGSVMMYQTVRDTFSQILPPRKINKAEMIHFLGTLYKALPLTDLIRLQQIYMGKIGDYDYKQLRQALVDMKGDDFVICPTYDTARRLADAAASTEGGNNVYVYQMDYVSACSQRRPWFGMSHGDDLPFLFGRPFDLSGGCAMDIPFSRTVMDLWTSFAKGRAPTGPNGIEWPTFSTDRMQILNIASKISVVPRIRNDDRCEFLKNLSLY